MTPTRASVRRPASGERRRLLALGLGVALPTVLLAVGWWFASLREQSALAREHAASQRQSAERIAAAVREGLEELRRREDARPFYLYNHFYSPPEVLAVGDAVAVSPLAAEPDDPRVLGYFQVDPGDRVRTPYPADDADPGPERARRVAAVVASPALAALRALSFGDAQSPALVAMSDRTEGQAPITTNYGSLGNQVYNDLAQAQIGDENANLRVQKRQIPLTSRKQVSWDAIQSRQSSFVPPKQAASAAPVFEQIAMNSAPSQQAPPPQQAAPQAPPPVRPAAPAQESEVDYTPMAYLSLADQLVLQRVVSHAGTGSVQGVLLDRGFLVDTWLPAVAERHAPAGGALVTRDPAACAAPHPVSEHLPGVALCFPSASSATPPPDRLAFQAGALLGLILVVGAGVFVVARAARRADELSAQKTAFVSAVSHELRTPLTTLRMHAEMLQEGLVPPQSLATFHDDLVRESVRLSRLVENVLAVSQLEEGRRVLDPRAGDLADHLREVVEGQARHVASKGFPPVELELPDDPVPCKFDRQAIDQIVVNLLDNALKYAADGPDRGLRVSLECAPDRAVIHVADRGPGIPEAERERVFDRFYRVQRESTAHTPGTGLGLSLVRDLARAHGGDVRVGPRPGGGADFEVWIPRTA
ncbi:MAG: HAMP domain-containing histidine kinase [Myxococcales bacterium]|nr:HAMP domain-containing histidine kinase [Myxococcales bacterium]